MTIELRDIGDRRTFRDFVDVVDTIYAGDEAYVRPLDEEMVTRFDAKKNPFFDHAEVAGWVAYKDGKPAGRITAQRNDEHEKRHHDGAGFFGFFDTVDDAEVARALLDRAAAWLSERGMTSMRGPFSLSINDETGCLVDGFDTPPMIGMPHHRAYQGDLVLGAGLTKLKDFYAWTYDVGSVPPRAQKAHDEILALPEVTSRTANMKDWLGDLRIIMSIFNDAWSDNWGFVPLTERELAKMADDAKLILMPEITRIVSIDGEPAAVALGLPNLNELIADLDGKLVPFGLPKLLYRLKIAGPRSGRLVILGIRRKWRHMRRYAGLSAFLYVQMNRAAHLLGLERSELSWTVEDNAPINVGIRLMGGRIYKTYRVWERSLVAGSAS